MKKYIPYMLIILILSCSEQDKKTNYLTVNGNISTSTTGFVFLEKLVSEGYEKVDSAKLIKGTSFIFHVPKGKAEIYRLNFFGVRDYILLLDSIDVTLAAEGNLRHARFFLDGSPELELLGKVNERSSDHELEKKMFNHKFLNLTNQVDSVNTEALKKEYVQKEREYHEYVKESIKALNGHLAAWLILNEHLNMEQNLDFYAGQIQLFHKTILDSWQLSQLNKKYVFIKKMAIGSIAPDFSLPDADGIPVQLSSFRDKYVYLDFWASWCQPCRAENPELVKVYNKYKGKHFEVLGISFDKKRENWIKAIELDGLEWKNVSDLKYFDSELIQLYNIVNVPTTILLDPNGRIIAKNIHSHELDMILKEKLK